jgi:hypothetical protein
VRRPVDQCDREKVSPAFNEISPISDHAGRLPRISLRSIQLGK